MNQRFNILMMPLLFLAMVAGAGDFTGIKIYINPGHGGYNGANDRNVATINYALDDTLGFWESKSNLIKGLYLRDLLRAKNAEILMSRELNREEDDRPLSQIAAEANANNVDAFISIHSNALGSNTGTNYLLFLYHGYDNQPAIQSSLPMAQAAWPRLISNGITVWTNFTATTNIRGDFSFYGNTSGLGVLRPLTVPGFLSEGSFHDYLPETHRLLNPDYCKLEAINLYRFYCDYFQCDLPSTGVIAGYVKGKDQVVNHPKFAFKTGTNDQWLPLNNARVKLMNAKGDSLTQYKIDSQYNGVFAFRDLMPGAYKLRFYHTDHTTKDTIVNVNAAATTYAKMFLKNLNYKDTTPDFPKPNQETGIVSLPYYKFGYASHVTPDWINQHQIKKVLFRNEKYYVLTKEPKILKVNAITNSLIGEMKLTNISGGTVIISDIAFTSDGYILACNKDTIGLPETKNRVFKIYTWEDDDADPVLLFQTQQQGNRKNGIIGETMAVSGPRWKCTIYTSSVTSENSKAIGVIGYRYTNDSTSIETKYMHDVLNYTDSLWGKTLTFQISPTGSDHLYMDSEKTLPVEFQFEWNKPDGSPLINKGVFAEVSGFILHPFSKGNFYFRHAKGIYMTAPVCAVDSTAAGVVMFDISKGLNQAVRVSDKLPETGLGGNKSTFMAAAAKVSGYDVELMIMAQNQGIGRYKTLLPAAKANVYASELSAQPANDGYSLKFTLNENANAVFISVFKGSNVVKTFGTSALTKGNQTVFLPFAGLPDGTFDWSVTATGDAVDRPVKISDNGQPQLQFYSPRGVAVDNSFESPYFGRIYASETVPGAVTNRTTKDGIYILNAALQDVTNQSSSSYAGWIIWGGANSPMRVAVAENGDVYLTDWSDSNSGVWIMNPANPMANFKPVFGELSRASNGLASLGGVNIHGSISHCWVTGTGENTKLYTFDQDYTDATATNTGNLLQYNIGTLKTPWQSAPSAVVYNDGVNGNLQQNFNSCIAPDGRGGWWISQYRNEDAAIVPSLIHLGSDGMQNFNSGNTPLLIGNSYTGGMAVTYEGNKIAMGCRDEVRVFSITYNINHVPSLTLLHSIKPAMGTNSAGLAYDRAGNLYVISNTSERLGVWAMPKSDNSFVSKAGSSQKIVISRTTANELSAGKNWITIYPNPASDNITLESHAEILQVDLFDIHGQLISSTQPNRNKVQLTISQLKDGIYFLKIKDKKGTVNQRFIKK